MGDLAAGTTLEFPYSCIETTSLFSRWQVFPSDEYVDIFVAVLDWHLFPLLSLVIKEVSAILKSEYVVVPF